MNPGPRMRFREEGPMRTPGPGGPMLHMMPGGPGMPGMPEELMDLDVQVRMGKGRLGVGVQALTPELAEYFGVKEGVLVTSVQKDGAAAKAGVKAGDIITTVDGTSIDDPAELRRRVWKDGAAADLSLGISRDKKAQTLKVQLPAADSQGSPAGETVKIEEAHGVGAAPPRGRDRPRGPCRSPGSCPVLPRAGVAQWLLLLRGVCRRHQRRELGRHEARNLSHHLAAFATVSHLGRDDADASLGREERHRDRAVRHAVRRHDLHVVEPEGGGGDVVGETVDDRHPGQRLRRVTVRQRRAQVLAIGIDEPHDEAGRVEQARRPLEQAWQFLRIDQAGEVGAQVCRRTDFGSLLPIARGVLA